MTAVQLAADCESPLAAQLLVAVVDACCATTCVCAEPADERASPIARDTPALEFARTLLLSATARNATSVLPALAAALTGGRASDPLCDSCLRPLLCQTAATLSHAAPADPDAAAIIWPLARVLTKDQQPPLGLSETLALQATISALAPHLLA